MTTAIVYKINGKRVSKAEFRKFHGPKRKKKLGPAAANGTTFRPSRVISSMALACHPDQIPEMEAFVKANGLNVHHNEWGEPQFDNFITRDKYAKLCGMHPLQLTHSAHGERIKRKF